MSCGTGGSCFSLRPRLITAKPRTPIRSRRNGMPRPRPKPRPSFRTSWELPVGGAVGLPVVVATVEVFARGEEKVLDVNDAVEDTNEVVDEDAKEVDMADPWLM